MSLTETVFDHIQSIISTTLGSEFKALSHIFELEKNTFKGSQKAYGLLPSSVQTTQGETKRDTASQLFEIILTDCYITQNLGDMDLRDKTLYLMGKFEELRKAIYNFGPSIPQVKTVGDYSIDAAVIASKEKVIIVRGTIEVQVVQSL